MIDVNLLKKLVTDTTTNESTLRHMIIGKLVEAARDGRNRVVIDARFKIQSLVNELRTDGLIVREEENGDHLIRWY